MILKVFQTGEVCMARAGKRIKVERFASLVYAIVRGRE